MKTLLEMANRLMGEDVDDPIEIAEKKEDEVLPAEGYKVGDMVAYKPSSGDYASDTVGKVISIMKNDVTVKTKNGKILIWNKQFVNALQ